MTLYDEDPSISRGEQSPVEKLISSDFSPSPARAPELPSSGVGGGRAQRFSHFLRRWWWATALLLVLIVTGGVAISRALDRARADHLAEAGTALFGARSAETQIWVEWLEVWKRDKARFRKLYFAGEVFRRYDYVGPAPAGQESEFKDFELVAQYRPDAFLDAEERKALRLEHPHTLHSGDIIRTVADWEPFMPAETGIATEYEKFYRGRADLIERKAKKIVAEGWYGAFVGTNPKPHQMFVERALIALTPGNEALFRAWFSPQAWYALNRSAVPVPQPTARTLADMRLLLAYDKGLFLDAQERANTFVRITWGRDERLFYTKCKGAVINTVADWERFIPLLPDGSLLPKNSPCE